MPGHKESLEVQRLEVVNTGRRRRWSPEEKLRIVEESYGGHRQVSATARRHDISASLLYSWRRAFREQVRVADRDFGFVPALMVQEEEPSAACSELAGPMEIVTTKGQRILFGADVDAAALARVVAALEGRPVRRSPEGEGG